MQITGGRVCYSRTVQPVQFESKKAEVELAFTLLDGETPEDALDEVGDIVIEKCLAMVGIKTKHESR